MHLRSSHSGGALRGPALVVLLLVGMLAPGTADALGPRPAGQARVAPSDTRPLLVEQDFRTRPTTVTIEESASSVPRGGPARAQLPRRTGVVRYVRPVASGLADGSDWANASADLQTMIDASATGDAVWVAAGVYRPGPSNDRNAAFDLKDGVEVLGGFAGSELPGFDLTTRDLLTNRTIFSGDLLGDDGQQPIETDPTTNTNTFDNAYTVVRAIGVGAGTRLDGVTVTAGNADLDDPATPETLRGAGVYLSQGTLDIANCRFEGGVAGIDATTSVGTTGGAALFVQDSIVSVTNTTMTAGVAHFGPAFVALNATVVLSGCDVVANRATFVAGAMASGSTADVTILDSTIRDNTAVAASGAMQNGGALRIERTTFSNNRATATDLTNGGGAIIVADTSGPVEILDSAFEDNESVSGGAIATNAPLTIRRTSFDRNVALLFGGGVWFQSVAPLSVVEDCTFTDNAIGNGIERFSSGAGINVFASAVQMTGSTFTANTALLRDEGQQQNWGGGAAIGLRVSGSPVTITDCDFVGNAVTGGNGGAILAQGSFPVISGALFQGNSATYWGGGIASLQRDDGQASLVTVSDSRFTGNSSLFGGGLMTWFSSALVDGAVFEDNTVVNGGGGVSITGDPSTSVTNAYFAGNSATDSLGGGGGILVTLGSTPSFTNVTLTRNTAASGAAVTQIEPGTNGTYVNVLVSENPSGDGTSFVNLASFPGSTGTLSHTLLEESACPPGASCGAGMLFGVDPVFASATDASLTAGSPVVNAGTNAGAPNVDLDGAPRALSASDPADMGAYEFQYTTSQAYVDAVLASGPVLYWRFEGGTTAATPDEISGLANNVLVPQQGATRRVGLDGLGMTASFDGSRGADQVPQPRFVGNGLTAGGPTVFDDYAIEMWVKLNDASGQQYLLEAIDPSQNNSPSIIHGYEFNGGVPTLEYFVGAPRSGSDGPTELSDNQWHHLVFEVDVATQIHRIFVDGVYTADLPGAGPWRLSSLAVGATAFMSGLAGVDGFIDELAFYDLSNSIVTGFDIAAHYSALFPDVTSAPTTPSAVPTRSVLHSNVPNPFNPSTTIAFDLARDEAVELTIYDVSGRRVRSLVQGQRSAGSHRVVWNGRDESDRRVASGVYLVRLTAGLEVVTRRMTMVK